MGECCSNGHLPGADSSASTCTAEGAVGWVYAPQNLHVLGSAVDNLSSSYSLVARRLHNMLKVRDLVSEREKMLKSCKTLKLPSVSSRFC